MSIKVKHGYSFWENYKPAIISAILIFGVIGLTVAMVLVSGGQPKTEAYIYEYPLKSGFNNYTIFKLEDKSYVAFLNQSMIQAPTLQELRGCIDQVTGSP